MPKKSNLGPHSIEAEEGVLGSILISAESLPDIADYLTSRDFFELKHGWIWEAILALLNRGDEIDNLTVVDELRNRGQLEDVGGASYITYLINNTPTHIYAPTYAQIVERASVRRRLMEAAGSIAQLAREANQTVDEIIAAAETCLSAAVDRPKTNQLVHISEASAEFFAQVERAFLSEERVSGLATGFTDLDNILGGLEPGRVHILAARPKIGKTGLAVNIMHNIARAAGEDGPVTAFFSLEMSRAELLNRMYAAESKVPLERLKRPGLLKQAEFNAFCAARGAIDALPIHIDDSAGVTVEQIKARLGRLRRHKNVKLVIVDYIQLISPSQGRKGQRQAANREQEVAHVSRALKVMAKDMDVAVLAIAQLNREVDKRQDKRPMLSDLRDSGALEQDADAVIFLYRDEVYNENTTRPNQADLIVAAIRHGQPGVASVYFQRELMTFRNMTRSAIDLTKW